MKVLLRRSAAEDLEEIFAYLAERNPEAARRTVIHIRHRLGQIAELGFRSMGRRGQVPGTRVIVEPPYLITYRVDERRDALIVLSIRHGRRRA